MFTRRYLGKCIFKDDSSHLKIKKGGAIDIDNRVTKQQYTTLLPLNGIKCGRKTSCMGCQHKKRDDSSLSSLTQMIMAQLAEWSLPTLEIRGSNPVIVILITVNCIEKTKIKIKRPEIVNFLKHSLILLIQ